MLDRPAGFRQPAAPASPGRRMPTAGSHTRTKGAKPIPRLPDIALLTVPPAPRTGHNGLTKGSAVCLPCVRLFLQCVRCGGRAPSSTVWSYKVSYVALGAGLAPDRAVETRSGRAPWRGCSKNAKVALRDAIAGRPSHGTPTPDCRSANRRCRCLQTVVCLRAFAAQHDGGQVAAETGRNANSVSSAVRKASRSIHNQVHAASGIGVSQIRNVR